MSYLCRINHPSLLSDMESSIKTKENVFIIDFPFLNFLIKDLSHFLEGELKREMPVPDLASLISIFAADAGLTCGNNEVDVFFAYDDTDKAQLEATSMNITDIEDVGGFICPIGNFQYQSAPTGGFTSVTDLFLELTHIACKQSNASRIFVLGNFSEYGNAIGEIFREAKEKETVEFRLDNPDKIFNHQSRVAMFPIMQSLGVKPEEV